MTQEPPQPADRWSSAPATRGRVWAPTTSGGFSAAASRWVSATPAAARRWVSAASAAPKRRATARRVRGATAEQRWGIASRGVHGVDYPCRRVRHRCHPCFCDCGNCVADQPRHPGNRLRFRHFGLGPRRVLCGRHVERGSTGAGVRDAYGPRVLDLELGIPAGDDWVERRQNGPQIQSGKREHRSANRFRHVGGASDRPHRRQCNLLHRLPVPAVGSKTTDASRQDCVHGLSTYFELATTGGCHD